MRKTAESGRAWEGQSQSAGYDVASITTALHPAAASLVITRGTPVIAIHVFVRPTARALVISAVIPALRTTLHPVAAGMTFTGSTVSIVNSDEAGFPSVLLVQLPVPSGVIQMLPAPGVWLSRTDAPLVWLTQEEVPEGTLELVHQ